MVVREDYSENYRKLESIIKDTLGLKVKRISRRNGGLKLIKGGVK